MLDILRKELIVTRFAITVLGDDGIFLPPEHELITIKASVQPTPAEEMSVLEEGYRTKDSFTLFTDTELKTARINYKPDLVLINNEVFTVIKVASWQNNLLPHYECIVIRVDNDDVN